ncbi:acetyl-CoA acetyltransferase [Antricoccus suffuscus]|uniref:Acetyl-CoA acetyltransferase n=1 Tax=Antricoccus suffuscus TaxID=1629062 RepID=A0A2T0ZFS7_9ACTN|nr:thiolase family protein [Antricoccus suffuscus]PRZ35219.1 acetyl-CoA acetyltransferase [Antricoccus suffuscus]
MAWISGIGLTPYGKQPGPGAVDWQSLAARAAMHDAGLGSSVIDGVLAGYATTIGHIMPSDLLAERLGIRPRVASGMSVGGATGLSMVAQAARTVDTGAADHVLVAGGEDRASGQSTETSTRTLAQVGHAAYEVPTGCTVPGYYALLASEYLHKHGLDREALAPFAVHMRTNALRHPGAQFSKPITIDDVLAARPIAEPLHLLDCCPTSDGGAAFVVTAQPRDKRSIRISGIGEGHMHQHISEADSDNFGARIAAERAFESSGRRRDEIDILGVYDSFTITIALLLEEIGFSAAGRSGADVLDGRYAADGEFPLNLHGGLLSYGHCGVAGGMAHLAEVVTQLRGEAGDRAIARQPSTGFVHADGGVMSAHVSLVVEAAA